MYHFVLGDVVLQLQLAFLLVTFNIKVLIESLGIIGFIFRYVNSLRARVKRPIEEERKYGKNYSRSKRLRERSERTCTQLTSVEKSQAMDHVLRKEQERYFGKDISSLKRDRCLPERSNIHRILETHTR